MDNSTMLSIKEFAEFTGLNETTLRYYDKINLLSPAIRGDNRYRYYEPYQTITADFIKVLTALDVPLSTIRELNKNRTPQTVLALLSQQQNTLNIRLLELQRAYSILHIYRNNIQTGMAAPEHDIYVQKLEETRIMLGPVNDFSTSTSFYKPFIDFCNKARANKIDLHYPIGGYLEDMDTFLHAPSQPGRFFALDPAGASCRAAGQYLVAYTKGFYGEYGDLPQRMQAYAQAHGLSFCGPVYSIYLLDEVSTTDHTQYLSQTTVGVRKKKY